MLINNSKSHSNKDPIYPNWSIKSTNKNNKSKNKKTHILYLLNKDNDKLSSLNKLSLNCKKESLN